MAIHYHRESHEPPLHHTFQQHDPILIPTGLSTARRLEQFLCLLFVMFTLCIEDGFDFFFVFHVTGLVLEVSVDAFDANDSRSYQTRLCEEERRQMDIHN